MRTVGIIAEYNPFHTGHAYHIAKAKELSGADHAVVVMSPDFVQRGEPAIFDKYTRTQMALQNGADLVLELPVCYAAGSAEYFAEGAVTLLDRLGVVDVLCFGGESDATTLFQQIACILLDEPEEYAKELKCLLKSGMTYPQARSMALERYLLRQMLKPQEAISADYTADPKWSENEMMRSGTYEKNVSLEILRDFLASPNNILGIEYCKTLKKIGSSIQPLPLKREGSQYNSTLLDGVYCSATAIRSEIRQNQNLRNEMGSNQILRYIPENCRGSFLTSCENAIDADAFLPFLNNRLLSLEKFDHILDISPDLSDRIRSLRFASIGKSFEEIVALLKTRQMTEARIRRALLHLILDIQTETVEDFRRNGTVSYAKVTGFRRSAAPLLHMLKEKSALPLITKNAQAPQILNPMGQQMWTQDLFASHLYRSVQATRQHTKFRTEYEISPVILP